MLVASRPAFAILAILTFIAAMAIRPAIAQQEPDLASLNAAALAAFQQGQMDKALQHAKAAFERARQSPDAPAEARANAFNNLAFLLASHAGEPRRAEHVWRQSLADMAARGETRHPVNLTTMLQLAQHLDAHQRPDEAAALLDRAQDLARGTVSHGTVAAMSARIHLNAGRPAPFVLALSETIDVQPDLFANSFGDLYVEIAQKITSAEADLRWSDAARLIEGQLSILRQYYHEPDRDQARRNLMYNRFFALVQAREFARAQAQIRVWRTTGELSATEKAHMAEMRAIALDLADGANIDTPERLATVRIAVLFALGADPEDAARFARALRTLATAEGYFDQFTEAAETLRLAVTVLESSPGGAAELPPFYEDLAWNAFQQGDDRAAQALFAQADAARSAGTLPASDPAADIAWTAANRARFALDTARLEDARLWIARAHHALEGADAAEKAAWGHAVTRARLAELEMSVAWAAGDPVPLEPVLAQLDALRPLAPEGSPDFALRLYNAADAAFALGKRDVARALLIEAIAVNDANGMGDVSWMLDTRMLLARLDLVEGDRAAAVAAMRPVLERRKAPEYRSLLPSAAVDFEHFAWALIEGPARTRADIDAAFQALQWTQITRSAEAIAALYQRLSVGDPRRAQLLERRKVLSETHARLSRQVSGTFAPEGSPAARRAVAEELSAVKTGLAEVDLSLDSLGMDMLDLGGVDPASLNDVQALLGPGELFVTFLLPSLNPERIAGLDASSNHVIALSADQVFLARLGEISRGNLNSRIQALRCEMAISDPSCNAAAQAQLRGAMQAGGTRKPAFDYALARGLYVDLFGGLEDVLPDYPHLIIAPPPDLLRLPYAALVTRDTAPTDLSRADWLVRRHAISVLPSVSSLRALRSVPAAATGLESMIGFGDPVIGEGDAIDCAQVQVAGLRAAAPSASALLAARPGEIALADVGYLSGLPRLPDSACELDAIRAGFEPHKSTLITGARATEAEVKALNEDGGLSGYDVVVFATHGLTSGEAGAASPGLVMTPPDRATQKDDGLLTAAEIALLDLNAQLVILSACNTAAGARAEEDGLSGLARAFFQSGARSLLVTHWSVYSTAAVDMSTGLFAELRADPAAQYAQALRAATLRIWADPARPAFHHHPSYWAAFSIVGVRPAADV